MPQRSTITTVTTATDTFKLTTVDNVRADLDLFDTSVTDDYLDRLVQQCSRAAAQYCNREFALQAYLDTVRVGINSIPYRVLDDGMAVANWPLVSVASVTEDGAALTAGTDYEVDLTNGIVYRLNDSGGRTTWPLVEILIAYQAGWTLPEQTTPAGGANALTDNAPDVEDAVIRMVKARLLARDRDPYLRAEDVAGVGSRQYWIATGPEGGNMPPDVTDILDNYRIPALA